jgi:DNA invertase Pin-like site-specific DNA recombinase
MKDIDERLNSKKAALYIRVSTHMQIDKDSLPLQENDLINYAKYALGIDRYTLFKDAGYSAKNTNRPDYQAMMTRLRTGEFSHLIVWKIDRISRNLIDFAEMYAELKRLGVTFVSKNEQFDTSTAMGEAMLKIILVFAELERNMTSERVTAIMLSRANSGQWNGGKIPFGYDYHKEDKTITVNAAEAASVLLLYSKYIETNSLLQVAKFMNDNHYGTRSGKPWNPTTVSHVIKSPWYVGKYLYNKHDLKPSGNISTKHLKKETEWILIENHHEPIVDEESWNKVTAMLKENRRSNKDVSRYYTRVNTHIFAGLLICGGCGSQMQSTLDRVRSDGYRPSIYLCSRHRRFNDCNNKYISDIVVGPFILNYIANIIKAQNNFGKRTDISTFEKKLLRGDVFKDVEHIERAGLIQMYQMIKDGKWQSETYTENAKATDFEKVANEQDILTTDKKKKERALARLNSLYLYNDDAIPEQEYLITRKGLEDDIERITQRLEEIEVNSSKNYTLSDDEFIQQASYFIMSQQLLTKRYIDFETLARKIDTKIIKNFVNSIIKKIVILDGKIVSISFKNGIKHDFLYFDSLVENNENEPE